MFAYVSSNSCSSSKGTSWCTSQSLPNPTKNPSWLAWLCRGNESGCSPTTQPLTDEGARTMPVVDAIVGARATWGIQGIHGLHLSCKGMLRERKAFHVARCHASTFMYCTASEIGVMQLLLIDMFRVRPPHRIARVQLSIAETGAREGSRSSSSSSSSSSSIDALVTARRQRRAATCTSR